MYSRVSINIVTWNSLTYLPYCLSSIYKQSYRDFSVLVVDNGSSDGTLEMIRADFPQVKMLRNTRNLGYSKAHNQGINLVKSEFVLVMNPDIILTEKYLESLVRAADRKKEGSTFGGKILRFHLKVGDLKEVEFTDKIDTIGLKPQKNRSFVDMGSDGVVSFDLNQEREIFGVSGGLLFLRKKDLDRIKINDEYFDEDFFAYKEDIDLAWRLRLVGLKSFYIPGAIAFHHRQAKPILGASLKGVYESRRQKSQLTNSLSYRNHLFAVIKNEKFSNLFWWFPQIFWYEFRKFLYLLFFETKTLRILASYFRLLPRMLKKRRSIQKNIKISNKEIRAWFK